MVKFIMVCLFGATVGSMVVPRGGAESAVEKTVLVEIHRVTGETTFLFAASDEQECMHAKDNWAHFPVTRLECRASK